MKQVLDKACEDGDLTREGVLKAKQPLTNVDTGGLVVPLDYSVGVGKSPSRQSYILQPADVPGGAKALTDEPVDGGRRRRLTSGPPARDGPLPAREGAVRAQAGSLRAACAGPRPACDQPLDQRRQEALRPPADQRHLHLDLALDDPAAAAAGRLHPASCRRARRGARERTAQVPLRHPLALRAPDVGLRHGAVRRERSGAGTTGRPPAAAGGCTTRTPPSGSSLARQQRAAVGRRPRARRASGPVRAADASRRRRGPRRGGDGRAHGSSGGGRRWLSARAAPGGAAGGRRLGPTVVEALGLVAEQAEHALGLRRALDALDDDLQPEAAGEADQPARQPAGAAPRLRQQAGGILTLVQRQLVEPAERDGADAEAVERPADARLRRAAASSAAAPRRRRPAPPRRPPAPAGRPASPPSAARCRTASGRPGSRSSLAVRLTLTGRPRRAAAVPRGELLRAPGRAPRGRAATMRPSRSASGTNSAGASRPSSGWRQRTSASTATTRPSRQVDAAAGSAARGSRAARGTAARTAAAPCAAAARRRRARGCRPASSGRRASAWRRTSRRRPRAAGCRRRPRLGDGDADRRRDLQRHAVADARAATARRARGPRPASRGPRRRGRARGRRTRRRRGGPRCRRRAAGAAAARRSRRSTASPAAWPSWSLSALKPSRST